MKSRIIPESELVSSFLGYTVAGFFLISTPFWAVAFAVAFALAEAWVGAWARLVPLVWVEAWVGFVPVAWIGILAIAGAGTGAVAGAVAGTMAWFVLWAVARRVAFAMPRGRLGTWLRVGVFAVTGAVTWLVFGSVAGHVALAMPRGEFVNVAVVVAWAWAWAWTWFLFEAVAGVVIGGLAWTAAGVGLAVVAGDALWVWAVAGSVAGVIAAAVSKARKDLLVSFSKWHTFLIMAATSLSGLGLGRLVSEVFFLLSSP
jgi:hypothetical protein